MGMTSHSGFSFRLFDPGARVARPFHAQRTGKPFKPREEGASEPENGKTRIADCKRTPCDFRRFARRLQAVPGRKRASSPTVQSERYVPCEALYYSYTNLK